MFIKKNVRVDFAAAAISEADFACLRYCLIFIKLLPVHKNFGNELKTMPFSSISFLNDGYKIYPFELQRRLNKIQRKYRPKTG